MAGLKPFYLLLGGIAVAGVGVIAYTATRTPAAPQARPAVPLVTSDTGAPAGHVMGSATAKVEVEEYADFECPACQRFTVLTMPDVVQRYVATGRVRWRFRDFPLSGHAKSPAAHEGAACAAEQGKFWEMHDQLYYSQNKWVTARNTERTIRGYAEQIGLDLRAYDECLDSDRALPRLQASLEGGVARGVNSTPTFIIGGKLYAGAFAFDQLKAILDSVAPAGS